MTFLRNKPDKKKYILHAVTAAAVIAVVLVIDLLTKALVVDLAVENGMPENGTYFRLATVIEGFFYITYIRNTGAAWSIGGGSDVFMTIVIVLTFVAVAVILAVIYFPDKRKNLFFVVGLALIAGGAVGNLVDRLMLGYVRDFLDFYPFGYNFPVVNVADMSLVVGVLMTVICILVFFFRPEQKVESENADGGGDTA